ncbi:MAG: esterase/lipase family protein, partial [Bacteroidota bacterium]
MADNKPALLGKLRPLPQPPLIRTRYPVVLMHGFGALAGIRRGGHLHEEAMYLRGHGVIAYAPNVAPYSTVRSRSSTWKRHLNTILDESGAERLNLIAQSMGGLDARYLISRLGMAEKIASLVTISTPHHGSSIAEFVLQQPQRIREWAASVADWMGTKTLPEESADAMKAVEEFTP